MPAPPKPAAAEKTHAAAVHQPVSPKENAERGVMKKPAAAAAHTVKKRPAAAADAAATAAAPEAESAAPEAAPEAESAAPEAAHTVKKRPSAANAAAAADGDDGDIQAAKKNKSRRGADDDAWGAEWVARHLGILSGLPIEIMPQNHNHGEWSWTLNSESGAAIEVLIKSHVAAFMVKSFGPSWICLVPVQQALSTTQRHKNYQF